MFVKIFPRCCGAGILVLENLTGKGEAADLEEIRKWVAYSKRNGYLLYDYPYLYEHGEAGKPGTGHSIIGGKGDSTTPKNRNGWGMLLAMTAPGQNHIAKRLEQFGFQMLKETVNPYYEDPRHKIKLWGLDLTEFDHEGKKKDPKEASKRPRGPDGKFISKAELIAELKDTSIPEESVEEVLDEIFSGESNI